jgi:hypothetical protein
VEGGVWCETMVLHIDIPVDFALGGLPNSRRSVSPPSSDESSSAQSFFLGVRPADSGMIGVDRKVEVSLKRCRAE